MLAIITNCKAQKPWKGATRKRNRARTRPRKNTEAGRVLALLQKKENHRRFTSRRNLGGRMHQGKTGGGNYGGFLLKQFTGKENWGKASRAVGGFEVRFKSPGDGRNKESRGFLPDARLLEAQLGAGRGNCEKNRSLKSYSAGEGLKQIARDGKENSTVDIGLDRTQKRGSSLHLRKKGLVRVRKKKKRNLEVHTSCRSFSYGMR